MNTFQALNHRITHRITQGINQVSLSRFGLLPGAHSVIEIALKKLGFEFEVRRSGDFRMGIWKRSLHKDFIPSSKSKELISPPMAAMGHSPKRIVFIPGFLDTPLSWLFVLSSLLPKLRGHYDEFAILDYPGFAGFLSQYRAFDHMDDLQSSVGDVLDSLRPDTIVAHSMGGYLATTYAAECGQLIRPKQNEIRRQGYQGPKQLILTAPSGLFETEHESQSFLNRFKDAVQNGFEVIRPLTFFKEPPAFKWISQHFHYILLKKEINAFIHSVRPDHRLNEQVQSLACKLWLIWGEHDRLVPTSCSLAWKAQVPVEVRRGTVLLKSCGHNPQIEMPRRLSALLLAILEGKNPNQHAHARHWTVA